MRRRTRVIYQGLGGHKWWPAQLEGDFSSGVLILDDGRRFVMGRDVDKKFVRPFTAGGPVEAIRLVLGIPEKMPLDLTGEWEFEGFRYKLFSTEEARSKKGFQRFCIWCDDCKKWVPAGRRFQEKHLRPLWIFKAEAERM